MSDRPLAGRRVVVTRPREQAAGLAARIREAGGEPVLVPAIEIRDPADLGAFNAVVDRLEDYDWAIFVSPTAVRLGMQRLRARRGSGPLPANLRIAAIGNGSRRALEEAGVGGAIAPAGPADSEALLAMPALERPEGLRIAVFRGLGGRELLGDTLRARGARVDYAECYVRARPSAGAEPLCGGDGGPAIDAITVSSGEGLANLQAMLDEPGRARLRRTPLFVPHARVAEQAAGLGAEAVTVAGPGDDAMLAALVAYFRSAK